jgi:LAS superfamily LD-carboxypeptidase LdcB
MQAEALFEAPAAHVGLGSIHHAFAVQEFAPAPVERPGGGRVRNNRDPAPADVVTVRGVGGRKIPLHRLAAAALRALQTAARRAGIREPLLLPVSGYRSSARQRGLFAVAVARYGSPQAARRWVAPPGHSAHQSGRAIDFYLGVPNGSGNVDRLRATAPYRWLRDNAVTYGFYPYSVEPWHWEYNPRA